MLAGSVVTTILQVKEAARQSSSTATGSGWTTWAATARDRKSPL